jgi:DNA-binding transcriptional LysR family regulator
VTRRPEITLTQLRYFIAAAEHLSMTGAAQEHFVAQSAVSAAVAQLEAQVGAQLFIRQRAKGLVLTAAGVQLLTDVRAVLSSLDDALDAARGVGGEVRGTVRVAFFVTLAPFALPEVLSRVRQRYPGLELVVDEVDAEGVREALRAGRAELAVGYDFGYGDDVEREVIDETRAHVVLPAGHPLALKESVRLRELSKEKLVLLDLPYSRDYFLQILTSVGLEPEIRHRTRNYETVRALVARGHGFSVLNQHPVHDMSYDGGRVVALPIEDDVPALPVVIARLRDVRHSARTEAVAAIVREVFAQRR